MEALNKLFRWILNFLRIKVIVVECVTRNKYEVITNFGGEDNYESFYLNKVKLIKRIREYETDGYKVVLETIHGDSLEIFENRYIRPMNGESTFKDLPSCL